MKIRKRSWLKPSKFKKIERIKKDGLFFTRYTRFDNWQVICIKRAA